MTTDAQSQSAPPEGGDQQQQPPQVDLGVLFQDGAELPDELKPLEPLKGSLKSYFDTKIGEAATQAQEQAAERMRQQQEAERARTQSAAQIQENISWAEAIEADLFSGDPEKASAAKAKRDAEPQRYTDAMAAKFSMARQQTYRANVDEFLNSTFEDMVKSGGQEIIDAMTPEVLAQHGNNPLRVVAAIARQKGEQAGYERGLAEGEQRRTVEDGRDGQPAAIPPRVPVGVGSIAEGVQLGRPGSTRELLAKYRSSKSKN